MEKIIGNAIICFGVFWLFFMLWVTYSHFETVNRYPYYQEVELRSLEVTPDVFSSPGVKPRTYYLNTNYTFDFKGQVVSGYHYSCTTANRLTESEAQLEIANQKLRNKVWVDLENPSKNCLVKNSGETGDDWMIYFIFLSALVPLFFGWGIKRVGCKPWKLIDVKGKIR